MMSIPLSLLNRAAEVSNVLLPDKSRVRYEEVYKKFTTWCNKEQILPKQVTDDVMLVYLSEKSKQVKPSTLWSNFSMIKSILKVQENINASCFHKTIAFLKKQNVGFIPKKSNVFTADQITKFMVTAPNNVWLMNKVILTIGIFGACRRDDLLNLKVSDVKDSGSFFTVFLKGGKTPKPRSFTITDEDCSYQPCRLLRIYLGLRPPHMKSDRLLVAYRNGKCVAQHVGMHTIGNVPKSVAEYLKLDHPETYTGHAMRRTSASMMVEGGADLLTLKRHGGWKSSQVAEGYIEDSLSRKIDVSKKLFSQVAKASSSQSTVTSPQNQYNNFHKEDENRSSDDDFFTLDDIFADNQVDGESYKTLQSQQGSVSTNMSQNNNIVNKFNNLPYQGITFKGNQNCTFHLHFNK